jgi:hypothetical protein
MAGILAWLEVRNATAAASLNFVNTMKKKTKKKLKKKSKKEN